MFFFSRREYVIRGLSLYINATKDNGIVFYGGDVSDVVEKNRIKVYVDSDHAGDLRTRKKAEQDTL